MIFCNGPLVGKKYFYKFFLKKEEKLTKLPPRH